MASALLPAAGRGRRFSSVENKVFADVAGVPVLAHTVTVFERCCAISEIVIVAAEDEIKAVEQIVERFGFHKVSAIVIGGLRRQDSVRLGLAHVRGNIVAIHDAARPLVTAGIIERTIRAASEYGASIAAVPVVDTIKSISPNGDVSATIDRSSLYAVQTPQTFRTELIRAAHDTAQHDGAEATDDSALVERLGHKVQIVEGSSDNFKITTPTDLAVASARLFGGESRSGFGFDVHQLVSGRRLILGGVQIEYEKGLLGHSDADVLTHAICDACLGAAALGDIGIHFPDTDPAYAGIDSLVLLRRTAKLLRENGWMIRGVDTVVVCQKPKISPHVQAMVARLSEAMRIEPERVNIKATTTEHLGYVGRSEGIACYATASVVNIVGGRW